MTELDLGPIAPIAAAIVIGLGLLIGWALAPAPAGLGQGKPRIGTRMAVLAVVVVGLAVVIVLVGLWLVVTLVARDGWPGSLALAAAARSR